MTAGNKRYVTVQAYDMQLDNGGEGTPHTIVSLRIVDGPDAGINLTWRGYLSEKAAPFTMKGLRALGWTGNKLSKAMAEGLGTRKATACLKMDEYKGKLTEKVDGIFEPKAFGPKNPVDETSLDAFDALFEDVAAGVEVTQVTERTKAGERPPAVSKKSAPKAENPNDLGF